MKSTPPAFEDSPCTAITPTGRAEPGPSPARLSGQRRASESSKRDTRADHVTCGGPENGLGFLCGHCGEGWTITSPAEITAYVAASKVFRARHVGCPKPGGRP